MQVRLIACRLEHASAATGLAARRIAACAGACWCRRGRELQCGAAQAVANLVNGRDGGLDLSHMTLENR